MADKCRVCYLRNGGHNIVRGSLARNVTCPDDIVTSGLEYSLHCGRNIFVEVELHRLCSRDT